MNSNNDLHGRNVDRLSWLIMKASTLGAIRQGTIKDVDKEKNCATVSVGGQDYYNVPLRTLLTISNFIAYPKIGTVCDIFFTDSDTQSPSILDFQDADSIVITGQTEVNISAEQITINGGSNGGVINIGELTDKLNMLVDAFNNHMHTNGNEGANTGVPITKADDFSASDYEDDKITH